MGRTSHSTSGRRRAIGALILAGASTLSACSGGDDDSYDIAAAEPAAEEPAEQPADEPSEGGFGGGDAEDGGPARQEVPGGTTGIDLGQIGEDVIVEMHVTVSSDDIQRAVSSVSARAAALGGGVASSDVNYGNPVTDGSESGYAVLVVKVPPAAVDELMSGIERIGSIQSLDQSAQVVTEQLVDLEVRIANARESVENVRAFMERAANLNDLVTLESELMRRQTELEQLEAQERNLSERVAFSTVTVEFVPTAAVPVPADHDDDTLADALRRGWDGFTTVIWGIGYVLAVLLPFLVVGALVASAALWAARRRVAARSDRVANLSAPGPRSGLESEESSERSERDLTRT
jgi:hypothetical protein